jgi:hypothetical protein
MSGAGVEGGGLCHAVLCNKVPQVDVNIHVFDQLEVLTESRRSVAPYSVIQVYRPLITRQRCATVRFCPLAKSVVNRSRHLFSSVSAYTNSGGESLS